MPSPLLFSIASYHVHLLPLPPRGTVRVFYCLSAHEAIRVALDGGTPAPTAVEPELLPRLVVRSHDGRRQLGNGVANRC